MGNVYREGDMLIALKTSETLQGHSIHTKGKRYRIDSCVGKAYIVKDDSGVLRDYTEHGLSAEFGLVLLPGLQPAFDLELVRAGKPFGCKKWGKAIDFHIFNFPNDSVIIAVQFADTDVELYPANGIWELGLDQADLSLYMLPDTRSAFAVVSKVSGSIVAVMEELAKAERYADSQGSVYRVVPFEYDLNKAYKP